VRVTSVEVTPVSVPFIEPSPWRFGVLQGVTTALLRVSTDEGLTGIGEAPGVPAIGIVLEALRFFTPHLCGADPKRLHKLMRLLRAKGARHFATVANVALGGIEIALWDLLGKELGRPLHELLGGADAEVIPFYWHTSGRFDDPGSVAASAAKGVRQGFTTLYLKGSGEVARDVTLLEAVRANVGLTPRLRVDPNEGWDYGEALQHRERLRSLELEFIEQPFSMDDRWKANALRRVINVPIAANQSSWLLEDVRDVLVAGGTDVVVTGISQLGGLWPMLVARELCTLHGVGFVRHSLCELGVGTAAALQALATGPPGQMAHQTHLQLLEHDLLLPRLAFRGGVVEVPRGPGLGVELDEAAVARYAENFIRHGEYSGYTFAQPG
jgi:L-alanine-DL-glutamate epimerase-like enolase superfamily enzyme